MCLLKEFRSNSCWKKLDFFFKKNRKEKLRFKNLKNRVDIFKKMKIRAI